MVQSARELVEQLGGAMARGDVPAILESYAPDASVVTYSRVATGRDDIRSIYERSLTFHGDYQVMSIDQFQEADAVVIWDATVQTSAGLLQTTHTIVRNRDGLIQHHVPGVRGYWGM